MRILQVSPKYFPFIGGVEEHVRNISQRLAKEHQVTVFATDDSGELPREEEVNGVSIKRFRCFAPHNAYHLSFAMWNELKKSEFDIVHGHSYHTVPLYFSRYAKRTRYVVTPHYERYGGTRFRNFLLKLYKPFGKRIFEEADSIITVSEYEKALLLQDFDIIEDKISLIPNGVNLEEFSRLPDVVKKGKTVLYAGRLEEYKGVQYLVEALPFLEKDFSLEIIGWGTYKTRLVELAGKLGVKDRVSFYQSLPRREFIKMLAEAGVFVLLSRYECFSIVVAEALAAKTPCIVANTSALREWVDGRNCFGIDYPIDAMRLAELIAEVGGQKVSGVKLWDWDNVVRELNTIYGAAFER